MTRVEDEAAPLSGGTTMTAYLYLICQIHQKRDAAVPCKVGLTDNPAARLRGLRTASPHKLVIYELWDFPDRESAAAAEKMAHACLGRDRMRGEWFSISPDKAVAQITLWLYWAAQTAATDHGDGEPMPPIPEMGVGMVANGRADNAGRLL